MPGFQKVRWESQRFQLPNEAGFQRGQSGCLLSHQWLIETHFTNFSR